MEQIIENRRQFLKRAATTAIAIPFLIGCKSDILAHNTGSDILRQIRKNARPAGAEGMGAVEVPDSVSWRSVLASSKDEGEPMIVTGTVYKPDGKSAAPDTLIYFYHTDMYGIYGRNNEPKHGRYRGWMLTDKHGRYEFSSIRPASYPNTTFAAHVHMTITGVDRAEDWIDSILFEDDKFISPREREMAGKRGGFQPILKLEKGTDGILRGVRDIQLPQV